MADFPYRKVTWLVALGDLVTYLVITLVGFGSHDTLAWGSLPRMLATLIPFSLSWFILAPWLGVYRAEVIRSRSHLPRVIFASLLAAPVGAFLRGLWLASPILPFFVIVMAGFSAAGMLAWRAILQIMYARRAVAG
ncbi:MAG: DUF3054 domain-containing protein [Anaerolineales bacterium]|nr:DUF3054 domain-containing protein [Anaerolineales bacterium]